MGVEVNKSKVLSSLLWRFLERGGTQGIQFIVQIMLARLLLPEHYGLIALVTVFLLLANVFVQTGFNTALIQKKDADEVDFSSVFYLSLFVAALLYTLLFVTSPLIGDFYSHPQFVPVLRVLSVTLFAGALNSIQIAFVSRHMMFKKLFFSSIGAIGISGTLGITAAYLGWGVWALVVQQLANQFSITMILWFTVKWRPRFLFSMDRVRVLFFYGWKLLVSSLLNTLYEDLRTLMIGWAHSPAMLGFYHRGKQFPQFIFLNIDGAIQSVMLPVLASNQSHRSRIKSMVRRSIVTSSFILFPMMVGLAVVSEPLVRVVLTEKWLPAVPFLQIYCAAFAFLPIHSANLQALNALGRTDIFLKLQIVKITVGLAILAASIPFGIYAIALGSLTHSVISTFINARPTMVLLHYGWREQWKDIMPSLLISLLMGAVVHTFHYLDVTALQRLVLQAAVGVLLYLKLSRLFRVESFTYLLATLWGILKGKKEMAQCE